jgi:hypothetical protein
MAQSGSKLKLLEHVLLLLVPPQKSPASTYFSRQAARGARFSYNVAALPGAPLVGVPPRSWVPTSHPSLPPSGPLPQVVSDDAWEPSSPAPPPGTWRSMRLWRSYT